MILVRDILESLNLFMVMACTLKKNKIIPSVALSNVIFQQRELCHLVESSGSYLPQRLKILALQKCQC